MKAMRGRVVAMMTAGALLILPMSNRHVTRVVSRTAVGRPGDPRALYTPQQKEYWLSADEFGYIRPGLNVTVNSITNCGPGKNPVLDVSMTDDLGQPVDRNGAITPGAVGMEFILARYDADSRTFTNYTSIPFAAGAPPTPLHDVGGTWTDLDLGHARYTFGLALPASFDVTQTATLGIYANRQTTAIVGKDYDAPAVVQYFRPDGGTPSASQWDVLDINACNQCHNPLSMHGQFGPPIQDVKLCVMCHTPDFPVTQTGESLDFRRFIHKLHRGADLPSVQAGTPYVLGTADFSTVVFPQDVRNCATCHSGPNPPPGTGNWYTYPSRVACGACHDDVNFDTGVNHAGGVQADDSQCAGCHAVSAPGVFDSADAPTDAAHWVPYKSDQLFGLKMTILSVANAAPGKNPIVTFQVTDKNGKSLDPRPFDTLQFTMGGPTADYATLPISEDAQAGTSFDGTNAVYAFTHAIPTNATGTWAITSDVEVAVVITRPNALSPIVDFTESPLNPIYYVAITDPAPMLRREVVDLANCNKCHDRLAAHGGRRLNTEACVICHNPINDDSSRRPADQNPPESISFQRMIHRIHSGTNLTQDFTIYGFGGRKVNFNGVLFPGDRRDCEKCHVPDTEEVPASPPPGRQPVVTARDYFTPMQSTTAACLGCHDTQPAAAHAFLNNTALGGEGCATCHAPGAAFEVDKVHAR